MRTKAEVDVNGGFRVTGSGKMGRPSWTESSSVKKADDARAELKQNLAASAQGTSEASGAPNRVNYRVAWGDGCKVAQENANWAKRRRRVNGEARAGTWTDQLAVIEKDIRNNLKAQAAEETKPAPLTTSQETSIATKSCVQATKKPQQMNANARAGTWMDQLAVVEKDIRNKFRAIAVEDTTPAPLSRTWEACTCMDSGTKKRRRMNGEARMGTWMDQLAVLEKDIRNNFKSQVAEKTKPALLSTDNVANERQAAMEAVEKRSANPIAANVVARAALWMDKLASLEKDTRMKGKKELMGKARPMDVTPPSLEATRAAYAGPMEQGSKVRAPKRGTYKEMLAGWDAMDLKKKLAEETKPECGTVALEVDEEAPTEEWAKKAVDVMKEAKGQEDDEVLLAKPGRRNSTTSMRRSCSTTALTRRPSFPSMSSLSSLAAQ